MLFKFALVIGMLEKIVPVSKVFESDSLPIYEVSAQIAITVDFLEEVIQKSFLWTAICISLTSNLMMKTTYK